MGLLQNRREQSRAGRLSTSDRDQSLILHFACGEVRIPQIRAGPPKRMGGFPFWRGDSSLMDTPERSYAAASTTGMEAFLQAKALPENGG